VTQGEPGARSRRGAAAPVVLVVQKSAHGPQGTSVSYAESPDLRDLLQRIDDASRYQLTTRLIVALNQNKLRLEGELPF